MARALPQRAVPADSAHKVPYYQPAAQYAPAFPLAVRTLLMLGLKIQLLGVLLFLSYAEQRVLTYAAQLNHRRPTPPSLAQTELAMCC